LANLVRGEFGGRIAIRGEAGERVPDQVVGTFDPPSGTLVRSSLSMERSFISMQRAGRKFDSGCGQPDCSRAKHRRTDRFPVPKDSVEASQRVQVTRMESTGWPSSLSRSISVTRQVTRIGISSRERSDQQFSKPFPLGGRSVGRNGLGSPKGRAPLRPFLIRPILWFPGIGRSNGRISLFLSDRSDRSDR
jgi:hypothetical protein